LYNTVSMRRFVRIGELDDAPDETTILSFRRLHVECPYLCPQQHWISMTHSGHQRTPKTKKPRLLEGFWTSWDKP
jgi:hypothetical protein